MTIPLTLTDYSGLPEKLGNGFSNIGRRSEAVKTEEYTEKAERLEKPEEPEYWSLPRTRYRKPDYPDL